MTEQQLDAIKRLAERHGSDLTCTDVVHGTDTDGPHGLPKGWVSVVVHKAGTPPAENNPAIVAGVSPEGRVHT